MGWNVRENRPVHTVLFDCPPFSCLRLCAKCHVDTFLFTSLIGSGVLKKRKKKKKYFEIVRYGHDNGYILSITFPFNLFVQILELASISFIDWGFFFISFFNSSDLKNLVDFTCIIR